MIKSYTDLDQSKKLVEILPLESADMYYAYYHNPISGASYYEEYPIFHMPMNKSKSLPCWSLAALLGVLPKEINIKGQRYAPCLFPVQDKWLLKLWYNSNYTITSPIAIFSDNPVDACVAMIEQLHELKML